METEMIERVSKAIFDRYVATFSGYGGPRNWASLDGRERAFSDGLARAAIEAMRELDDDADAEMLIKGHAMVPELNPTQGDVKEAWEAMIDAALKT